MQPVEALNAKGKKVGRDGGGQRVRPLYSPVCSYRMPFCPANKTSHEWNSGNVLETASETCLKDSIGGRSCWGTIIEAFIGSFPSSQ